MRRHAAALALLAVVTSHGSAADANAQRPGQHNDADRAPFLNNYVGQYRLTDSFRLDITRVGDALYVQGTGQPRAQLRPRSQTEFVIVGSSLRLLFEYNALTGEVDHLVYELSGLGRRAEKLSETERVVLPRAVTLSPDALARYVGSYEEQPGFAITVTLENGQLMAGMEGGDARVLLAESETSFFYEDATARVTFEMGDDGEVERLILHQGGSDVEMNRQNENE